MKEYFNSTSALEKRAEWYKNQIEIYEDSATQSHIELQTTSKIKLLVLGLLLEVIPRILLTLAISLTFYINYLLFTRSDISLELMNYYWIILVLNLFVSFGYAIFVEHRLNSYVFLSAFMFMIYGMSKLI